MSFASPSGRIDTTLYSTHSAVPGVLGVAGVIQVSDGSSTTNHDLVGILRGFYVIRTGELVAASSPGVFEVALTALNSSSSAAASVQPRNASRQLLGGAQLDTDLARELLNADLVGVSFEGIRVLHSIAGQRHASEDQLVSAAAAQQDAGAPPSVRRTAAASPSADAAATPSPASSSMSSLSRRCSLLMLGGVRRASGGTTSPSSHNAPVAASSTPSIGTRVAARLLQPLFIGSPSEDSVHSSGWSTLAFAGEEGSTPHADAQAAAAPKSHHSTARRLSGAAANPPVFVLNASLSTWNCDFQDRPLQLEATAVMADKPTILQKAAWFGILATVATVAQLGVLVPALIQGAAPANGVRVSLLTLGMQASLDAHLTLAALLGSVLWDAMFGALATLAFLKLIQFSLLEMRFMVLVHKAQNPGAYTGDWSDAQRALTGLYAKFYLVLLASLILLYFFAFSALPSLVFLAYSFWVPQILHSAFRGTTDGLPLRYIAVVSVSRMLIPLYFYLCPVNFVVSALPNTDTNVPAGLTLLAWMALQVAVLMLQRHKGPRFFVPSVLLPQPYDYHRRVYVQAGRVLPTPQFPDNPAEAAARALDEQRAEMQGGQQGGTSEPPTRLQTMWRDVRLQWRAVGQYVSDVQSRVRQSRESRGGYTRVEGGFGNGIIDGVPPMDILQAAEPGTEAEFGLGEGAAVAEDARAITCAICMCDVEFPVASAQYMVTPCNHLFHKECLAQWLDQKLECPVCRHMLPSPEAGTAQPAASDTPDTADPPLAEAV